MYDLGTTSSTATSNKVLPGFMMMKTLQPMSRTIVGKLPTWDWKSQLTHWKIPSAVDWVNDIWVLLRPTGVFEWRRMAEGKKISNSAGNWIMSFRSQSTRRLLVQ